MTSAASKPLFVYVIGYSKNAVKVGFSNDPETRAFHLRQKGEPPLKVFYAKEVSAEDARGIEELAHWNLRAKALGHEWFAASIAEASSAVADAALRYSQGERAPRIAETDPRSRISLDLPMDLLERVNLWCAEERPIGGKLLTFPAAIRQLVTEALDARAKAPKPKPE